MTGGGFHEAFWSQRYREAGDDFLFGTAPNRYLRHNVGALAGGNDVLCVADGEGRNSVWLAEQGYLVTATEISPVALEKARKFAAGRQVAVSFEQADLLTCSWPAEAYDALVAIFIQFVGPVEREALFAGMQRAVRPGGVFVLQGYTPKQIEYKTGGPPSVENLYTEEWVRATFASWHIERLDVYEDDLSEGCAHKGRSALLGLIARKPA